MARVTLPEMPDPANFEDVPSWQSALLTWADDMTSKVESGFRDLSTPIAPFTATGFTTSTIATARNVIVGTNTATDVASANVLATLVQDLIAAGILSPNLTR